MRLEQQLTLDPGDLHRLVDQSHPGSDGHQRKERSDVFRYMRMQPCVTAMRPPWGCWCHEACTRRYGGQPQGKITEWIVGARPHDLRQRIAILGVLLADRLRRIPGRVFDLGDDPRLASGVRQSILPMLTG